MDCRLCDGRRRRLGKSLDAAVQCHADTVDRWVHSVRVGAYLVDRYGRIRRSARALGSSSGDKF